VRGEGLAEDFAEAFLEEVVTLHKQRRVADASGGSSLVPWRIEGVRASLHPGDASEAEEGGRVVRVQYGQVQLPAQIALAKGDQVEHQGERWEVIGMDDQRPDRALTTVEVKRLVK
jgi:hypothetical protein